MFYCGVGCCRRKWKDWNCKFWFIVHTICWAFSVVTGLFLFLFFTHYPSIEASRVTPTHVLGSNVLLVDTGDSNVGWSSTLRVGMSDCAGTVFVFPDTNCSILAQARIENPSPLRHWTGTVLRYFLEDSYLTINYSSGYHDFAVLKSFAAHEEYLTLCRHLNDTINSNTCRNDKTLPFLCAGNSSASPLLRENMWCFKQERAIGFHINESDFYSLILNFHDGLPYTRGVNYIYDPSILRTFEDRLEYNITGLGGYASFPMSKSFDFGPLQRTCIVLQSLCSDELSTGSDVEYQFERRLDVLVFPSSVTFLCLCAALCLVAGHVSCVRRRNRRIERERD